jgi:uncharacterized protein
VRLLLVAAVFAVLAFAGPSPGADSARLALKLDGVTFRPEIAMDADQRSRGLMHRLKVPVDGMLFVFPEQTTGGFWMKNTLVPLSIAFFDSRGKRVRRLTMQPCRRDPCPLYSAGRSYRYALELRANDTRPARTLGPLKSLERLVASAS